MHIPDGYISPKIFIPFYLLFILLFKKGIKKLRMQLNDEVLPLLSSLTALSFIIMMFNIPIPGGTSGHALGATLIAIIFGPWASFMAICFVLLLQALLFGDGGITTYAINAITMGYISSFSGYYTYKLLKNKISDKLNYFFSGWISIVLTSIAVAIVLGIEPYIAKNISGAPLYFPFDLKITIPAIVGSHILFFGFVEGVFTMFGISYFKHYFNIDKDYKTVGVKKETTDILLFFLVVLLIMLFLPLGIITENPAWGEWEQTFFNDSLGFIPQGIKHFSTFYSAPLSDYTLPGFSAVASYYLSAILAFFITTFVFYIFSNKRNVIFDKLLFVNYLLVILAIVVSSNLYFILVFLIIALLLSGKNIFKLILRTVVTAFVFNFLSSIYFIITKNYTGLIIFNLRTFTILYFTLLAGKKLNIFAIFSFSPFISFILTLAYSQIINYITTYEQMKQALESRIVKRITLKNSYHILGFQVNAFIKKSFENSKEIMHAINSRSIT